MALKLVHPLAFFVLLFIILSPFVNAKRHILSNNKPSPFDFIKNLEGYHKGNTTKGVSQLKNYLQQLGYLNQAHATNDDVDEFLYSAIKTYQKNYHIKPTGILDATTISRMIAPRCGVPDIVNGTNMMDRKGHNENSKGIHTISHYSFFQGNPRWPSSKYHLTYRFLRNTPAYARLPVVRAFRTWDSATHFSFRQVSSQNSDLVIGFFRGNHGDRSPFDGPGGVLAHAFPPPNGRFHYDGAENWYDGASPNTFDYQSLALHEIGHLLGLHHSNVFNAIMYPTFEAGQTKRNLHPDDINGIRDLYDV